MEVLLDPVGDRMVKTVTPPPHRPLSYELMFPASLKGSNCVLLKTNLIGK